MRSSFASTPSQFLSTSSASLRMPSSVSMPRICPSISKSAYVSILQHASAYVSIRLHTSAHAHAVERVDAAHLHLRCQYLYFCTSKASKLSTSLLDELWCVVSEFVEEQVLTLLALLVQVQILTLSTCSSTNSDTTYRAPIRPAAKLCAPTTPLLASIFVLLYW
jgi:hypothetical protein